MPKRSEAVIDFETGGIKRRPEYPPAPVGVSIIYPGKKPQYFGWGHPEGNNCDESVAKARVIDLMKDSSIDLVFHNAKFDLDVAQTHWNAPAVDWRRVHDTLYLLFLEDPHQKNLSLKPSAERLLDMPPEERDAVHDWIMAHKKQIEAKYGEKFTPKQSGAYICEAPGDLVGPYANGDTLRTQKLFKLLRPRIVADGMGEAYDRERQLMPILLENERQGMRVDLNRLDQDIVRYRAAQNKVEAWLRKRLKSPTLDFEKDRQVADALERAGVVVEFNLTAKGQKSVSKQNLTVDMYSDPKVFRALGYRNRLQTSLGTFMEPWQALAHKNNGRIHTNWNQVRSTDHGSVGARTGRMSSSPNFQNIPTEWYDKGDDYAHPKHIDVPELPMIRGYVIGDSKNHSFGGRDYNQQELRILAHFEDDKLMGEYNANPLLDVHSYVREAVTRIIGYDPGRKPIKVLNFGTIYGMGLGKLAASMGVDVNTAKTINSARKSSMPGIKALEEGIKRGARSTDEMPDGIPIRTWGGRLYYKEPPILFQGRHIDFGYKLLNYLIQGSAADCTKQAIINYDQIKQDGRLLAQVHDELNISAPTKLMKKELKLLGEAMFAVKFDVPMVSEPYFGPSWGEVVKYKEN